MKWEFLLVDLPIVAFAAWQLLSLRRLKQARGRDKGPK